MPTDDDAVLELSVGLDAKLLAGDGDLHTLVYKNNALISDSEIYVGATTYRGQALRLAWEPQNPRRPVIDGDALRIGGPQVGLEGRLKRWLEAEALRLAEADMRDYCAAARLDPVPIGLTRAQRRWGSCSDNRRIRINWRLVQAPDFVRRSVVAHEVTHLVHFDHSPAFHALLGQIFEGEITAADSWLKEHGRGLYAGFG
jgi:predicted metal-dependent hydrolase